MSVEKPQNASEPWWQQNARSGAVFAVPTSASIVFSDIESLIVGMGGNVHEGEGSRVKLVLGDEIWRCHRPHPGKEARRYQVEEIREILKRNGATP